MGQGYKDVERYKQLAGVRCCCCCCCMNLLAITLFLGSLSS
jgi:hypothetical protein